MDIRTFKKKILHNKVSKTVSIVTAVLTVVFLFLGFSGLWADKSGVGSIAGHKSDAGTYAYLDVIAFEEWVCKYGDDTFYTLYDASGESYLAVVSDLEMRKMTGKEARKEDYVHFFDGSYRLYGLVKRTEGKVISLVEQAYDITGTEFKEYFGTCYFNTTENPNTENEWMWRTFALATGLTALIAFIIWYGQERPFNRECRDYEDEEFEEAARMMDEADPKQRLIFGEKYIVNRAGTLMRYSDILWIHRLKTYMNGVYMGQSLQVHTRNRNEFKLPPAVRDSEEELQQMAEKIIEKQPDVLVGYNDENRREYNTLTRI